MDKLAAAEKRIKDLEAVIDFIIQYMDHRVRDYVLQQMGKEDARKSKMDSRPKNK